MKYQNIREEELKNKLGQDFFYDFDTTKIVGNIDFCVTHKTKNTEHNSISFGEGWGETSLLWAEAKRGNYDVLTMITQLVLTIGKARTFDKFLPPAFLGAFDSNKMGFVTYNSIVEIFSINDFNWNVTPSNHETKEFKLIKNKIEQSLQKNYYVYDFAKDQNELAFFIKTNIAKSTDGGKIAIDKNNFVSIYLRWLEQVKPHINFDWTEGKKQNISDNEFYLADLFVDDKGTSEIEDDTPLSDNLFVVFRNSHYEIAKENLKSLFNASIEIKNKDAYEQFWKKYKRPPLAEFQQYIIMRKDLLVPQDIRERKGAFFTPKKWVELSQQYIADVLGDDWQDDYYVWDCAAGTGNLFAGLTNKYNIWASTLDQSDVNAMHDRIENGALLLKDHCFQFDFLNDDFSKLPDPLQFIINNPEKRKKLLIYINPPYAEAASKITVTGSGENKSDVAVKTYVYNKYQNKIGIAGRELFAQFFVRIYAEIEGCVLAEFSTLKILQAPNFKDFRRVFQAKLEKMYVVPADTFDNVKGKFPIGFFIWNTSNKENFIEVKANVFDDKGETLKEKTFSSYEGLKSINDWIISSRNRFEEKNIGFISCKGNDFQNTNFIFIINNKNQLPHPRGSWVTDRNIINVSIYYAVRHCIDATWLNDRDQFLFPNEGWQKDSEFQNDCLAFTLFNTNIQSKFGTNHWIPFTENEVNAREKFKSNFMTQFIKGKIKQEQVNDLFVVPSQVQQITKPLEFSEKATNVFNAGRELWNYYHAQPNVNVNASLYDIREHFQGRNDKGKMNNKSGDETYMKLISSLRESLKILAKKIEPKVYEYGFLKM
jgi:hypothetical protein